MKKKLTIDKDLKKYKVSYEENNFGSRYVFKFKNNLGASVIKKMFLIEGSECSSIGYEDDLWELVLFEYNLKNCPVEITRLSDIRKIIGIKTNNYYLGNLTDIDVNTILHKIMDYKIC